MWDSRTTQKTYSHAAAWPRWVLIKELSAVWCIILFDFSRQQTINVLSRGAVTTLSIFINLISAFQFEGSRRWLWNLYHLIWVSVIIKSSSLSSSSKPSYNPPGAFWVRRCKAVSPAQTLCEWMGIEAADSCQRYCWVWHHVKKKHY